MRCERLLDAAAERPLTLIVAGAGWGKTSVVSAWSARAHAAWITLEPRLADPARFWQALVAALELAGARQLPVPSEDPSDSFPRRLADAVAASERPLRLVLDEFDHIGDPLARAVEELLHHSRERLSLVLASRRDPPFRLQRLRLSGLLAELHPADLRFTLEECAALMRAHELELPEPELELLLERTQGWPAGLGLAALALRREGGAATTERALAAAERDLSDYLLEEVLARQDPHRLELLLRCSILDRIDAELANALTGSSDGASMLAAIAREGFLSVDDVGSQYRCHPLLAGVLRSEAGRRLNDELPRLQRVAAETLARRGDAFAAIRHAIAGEDWERAGSLVGEHWMRLVVQGGSDELAQLAEHVPDEVVRADAELALAAAALSLEAGEDRKADELLAVATRLAPKLPEHRRARVLVTSTATELYRARSAGDVEQSLRAARATLVPGWERNVDRDLEAITLANLGATEFWAGEFEQAGADLERAAGLAEVRRDEYLLFAAQTYAVGVDLGAGRLDDVRRRAHAVDELARARGWTETAHVAIAYLSLGAAHMWAHELEAAEHWAERARRAVEGPRDRLPHFAVAQLRAVLLGLRGETPTALEVLRRAQAVGAPLPRPLRISGQLVEADLRLALGEAEQARALLESIDAPEAAIGLARVELATGNASAAAAAIARFRLDELSALRPYASVEAWLIDAIAHDVMRDEQQALRSLERALDYAEPRGFRHPFLRLGIRVRSLLRRLPRAETPHRALVEDLLDAFDAGEPGRPAPAAALLEPLSERELTVLRFLPTMMSNAEIAAEMFVSVNTIKTHLRRVYAKLGAGNRRDAVRRARQLQLLSPRRRAG